MTKRDGQWSVVAGGVCALVVLVLVTMLAFRVTDYLRHNLGWTGANIGGHWILLLCALLTGVLAIRTGVRAIRVAEGSNRRLGFIGFGLGVLSLAGLAIWELLGGFFALFWDV